MFLNEYARVHGLDQDAALTHLVTFNFVEASLNKQRQHRLFQTLVKAVDAHKLAAAMRQLATELVEPVEGSASTGHDGTEANAGGE